MRLYPLLIFTFCMIAPLCICAMNEGDMDKKIAELKKELLTKNEACKAEYNQYYDEEVKRKHCKKSAHSPNEGMCDIIAVQIEQAKSLKELEEIKKEIKGLSETTKGLKDLSDERVRAYL